MGAKSITAIGVHGLKIENAESKMKKAGVNKIVTTNTIKHKTNGIDISELLIKEF